MAIRVLGCTRQNLEEYLESFPPRHIVMPSTIKQATNSPSKAKKGAVENAMKEIFSPVFIYKLEPEERRTGVKENFEAITDAAKTFPQGAVEKEILDTLVTHVSEWFAGIGVLSVWTIGKTSFSADASVPSDSSPRREALYRRWRDTYSHSKNGYTSMNIIYADEHLEEAPPTAGKRLSRQSLQKKYGDRSTGQFQGLSRLGSQHNQFWW